MQNPSGWFFDGQTPERILVLLSFGDAALDIENSRWSKPERWPYSAIEIADLRPDGGAHLRLAEGDARLVIDGAALAALAARAPTLSAKGRGRSTRRRAVAAVIATLGAVALFYVGWPPLADALARLMPDSAADAMGRVAATEIAGGRRQCSAPVGSAVLNALVDRLAAPLSPPRHFQARVVDVPIVNAFAAPGGHIVVFRGLLDAAASPDELAGVLAHEMGHVIERHPQRLIVRASGLSMLSTTLVGNSSFAGLGTTLVTLSYSRDFERQADADAVDLLAAAKLDTRGLGEFFARLETGEHRGSIEALQYLSTHPPTAERRRFLEDHVWRGSPALTPQEWQDLRRICRS